MRKIKFCFKFVIHEYNMMARAIPVSQWNKQV